MIGDGICIEIRDENFGDFNLETVGFGTPILDDFLGLVDIIGEIFGDGCFESLGEMDGTCTTDDFLGDTLWNGEILGIKDFT